MLSTLLPYGPLIAEHCILSSGLQPGRLPAADPLPPADQAALLGGVRAWEAWLDACEDSSEVPPGFILTRPPAAAQGQKGQKAEAAAAAPSSGDGAAEGDAQAAQQAAAQQATYEEFEPVLLAQHAHKPALSFPTFDAALAEFFGRCGPALGDGGGPLLEAARRLAGCH